MMKLQFIFQNYVSFSSNVYIVDSELEPVGVSVETKAEAAAEAVEATEVDDSPFYDV